MHSFSASWRRRGVSDVGKQVVALVTRQIWKPSASSASLLSSSSTPSSTILIATNYNDSFISNSRRYTTIDSSPSVDDKVYEKNPDDGQGSLQVVPDELIQPELEEYWTPHPQTGVFVPPSLLGEDEDVEADTDNDPRNDGESVLDQTAFFRPTSIEDMEKPIDLMVDPSDQNEASEQE